MAREIERKYLLKNDSWRKTADEGVLIRQGYMAGTDKASIRIRRQGEKANINIKSATLDIIRTEYEYEIPVYDAEEMLAKMCFQPLIEKTRYHVDNNQHTWEIDVFAGDNAGLIVAEVELNDKDEKIELPQWVGDEVSDDARYYNVNLVNNPFKNW